MHAEQEMVPLAVLPIEESSKRFRVTTSSIAGKLSNLSDEAADVYHEVAECILSDGYLTLTEAARMLNKKHTGRALEKLMENLPLVAFSSSRKEGWFLIPKGEEQYASIQALIQRAAEQEATIANFGNLSPQEFSDLTALCSPVEKLLMRYMLSKIYGTEEAAERFNLARATLENDLQRVANAMAAVEDTDTAEYASTSQSASGYKRQRAFHEALKQKQHGGRQAWEKNDSAKAVTLAIVQEAVHIHLLVYYFY